MRAAADEATLPDDLLARCVEVATLWLYRATGRQFRGECSATVRPVPQAPARRRYAYDPFPPQYRPWRDRPHDPRREYANEVTLGYWPVRSIVEVVVDGVVLPSSSYRLDDEGWLVRTDGDAWPIVNDWESDATDVDTWAVTFTYGADPPADGVMACAILAGELALSAVRSDACRLPRRVQSITRQGVTTVVVDRLDGIGRGQTGIPDVDAFIKSVNPHGLTRRSAVISPDVARPVRRTGTVPGS